MQITDWRVLLPAIWLASSTAFGAEPPAAPAPAIPIVTPDAGPRDTSLGRLEDIQAKTLLYEAQLAQAKAFNELQKNGYDAGTGGPFNPQPAAPVKDSADVRPEQESKALPLIVEISGGGQLSATLQLEGGNQIRVQAGSRIPGTVWTVAKITFSEVTVSSTGGGLVSLAFAGGNDGIQ